MSIRNAFQQRRPLAVLLIGLVTDAFFAALYLNRGPLALSILAINIVVGAAVFMSMPHYFGLIMMSVKIALCVYIFRLARITPWVGPARFYARWYGIGLFMLAICGALFLFRALAFEPFHIPGHSMMPSVQRGEYVWSKKYAYRSALPARGDLVTFWIGARPDVLYLKRVIGLPGDKVEIQNGRLILNGEEAAYETVDASGAERETLGGASYCVLRGGEDSAAVTVPPDSYFVLGDHRAESHDSRFADIGMIPITHVTGRAVRTPRLWQAKGEIPCP